MRPRKLWTLISAACRLAFVAVLLAAPSAAQTVTYTPYATAASVGQGQLQVQLYFSKWSGYFTSSFTIPAGLLLRCDRNCAYCAAKHLSCCGFLQVHHCSTRQTEHGLPAVTLSSCYSPSPPPTWTASVSCLSFLCFKLIKEACTLIAKKNILLTSCS